MSEDLALERNGSILSGSHVQQKEEKWADVEVPTA